MTLSREQMLEDLLIKSVKRLKAQGLTLNEALAELIKLTRPPEESVNNYWCNICCEWIPKTQHDNHEHKHEIQEGI